MFIDDLKLKLICSDLSYAIADALYTGTCQDCNGKMSSYLIDALAIKNLIERTETLGKLWTKIKNS